MRPWPRPPGTTAGGIRHGRRPSRTWLAVRCGDSRHSAGCAGLRVTLQLMEGRVRNSTRTVSVRAVVAGRRAGRLRVLHPITGDPDQTTGPTDTLVQEGEVSSRPTFPRMGNQPTAFLPAGGRVRTVSGTAVERKPGGDLLFGCGRRQLPLTTYSTSGHPHHPVGRRPGDACVLSPYHLRARRFSIRCRAAGCRKQEGQTYREYSSKLYEVQVLLTGLHMAHASCSMMLRCCDYLLRACPPAGQLPVATSD